MLLISAPLPSLRLTSSASKRRRFLAFSKPTSTRSPTRTSTPAASSSTAQSRTDSLLWMEYAKTKRPVAFARATGDGVFNAIIWDVVVDPSFQGIGLGRAVMERLVEELVDKGRFVFGAPGSTGPWALWPTRMGSAEWCIPESQPKKQK